MQLGIIILLFTFLGTYLDNTIVPNQQIVIQFSNENISSEDANTTIEDVKEKLQSIGVLHISIGQHEDGKLKITYYSDADVNRIQNILSNEGSLKLAYQSDENRSSDYPENSNENDYKLNISEIQKDADTNWHFDGIQITELNQKTDRFNNPTDHLPNGILNSNYISRTVEFEIKRYTTIALAFDHISNIIPEVRAGPSKREFRI
ncbi:hypothetical protein WPG_0444 [Winogradskyella sp. PG-2]|nr:hypothetical protein WPG_0444 [Winogradskyella sp. PG-2]